MLWTSSFQRRKDGQNITCLLLSAKNLPLHNCVCLPPRNCLPSRRPLRTDTDPTNIVSQWGYEWKSAPVVNSSLVDDHTIRQPALDLQTRYWALLNRFQINQGLCASCQSKWAFQQLTCAVVANAKRCHILSTAVHSPSWRRLQ